jgi:hypothetical protein
LKEKEVGLFRMIGFRALKCGQTARFNNRRKWSNVCAEVNKCRKKLQKLLSG